MNEKSKIFRKLLPTNELFVIYQKLAETIITRVDVRSLGYDSIAVDNSISLLCDIGLIFFNKNDNIFQQTTLKKLEITEFTEEFYLRLQNTYSDVFNFIDNAKLLFDEAEGKLYIKRNSVSLELSGLLMILDGLEKIKLTHNDIFILDKRLLNNRKEYHAKSFHYRSLEDLKDQLEKNEAYGVEAELAAMEYETVLLKKMGINKLPERISEYNTSAGYDIASFTDSESMIPDKFIEVKSCSDSTWTFYISKNEVETAKIKQDRYYLYLFNRKFQQFKIIKNPYSFFTNDCLTHQWAIESQIYKIKSLEGLLE